MNHFPTPSDDELLDLLGRTRLRRASNYLAGRHLDAPTVHPNGVLSARWKDLGVLAAVFDDGGVLNFDCDCDANVVPCDHVATLLLAWVRRPETFTHASRDFDEAAFGEMDDDESSLLDEDDLFDDVPAEAGPGDLGMPAHRAAPHAPVTETATDSLTARSLDSADYYRDALQTLTVPQLRALAERRGVAVSGTRREGIVETLAQALGRPEALAEVWPSLSRVARLVLSVVPFLTSPMGTGRQFITLALDSIQSKASRELDAALNELKDWGLLFTRPHAYLSAPDNLALLLPPDAEFVPPASTRGLQVVEAADAFDFPQSITHLLLVLRSEAAQLRLRPPQASPYGPSPGADWPYVPEELAVLKRERLLPQAAYGHNFSVPPAPRLLDDASEARLSKALAVTPERLDFSLRLLAKLGAVTLAPGQSPQMLEAGLVQYLTLQPLLQIAPLFNAWLSMRDWIELDLPDGRAPGVTLKRLNLYSSQETHARFLSEFSATRISFTYLLRRAPAGEWVDLNGLIARAFGLNTIHAMWFMPQGLWLESNGRRLVPQTADDWRTMFAPWLQGLLTGPMHWLGLVDLGYRKRRLAACRLTPLGAFVFRQSPNFKAPPIRVTGSALRVTPQGELVVTPGAAEPKLLNLFSLLCDVRPSPTGKSELLGRVTPEGALRAAQAGWDAGDILALLERSANAAPPADLARTLRDWWTHLGDVHLYQPLALLELADDYALNELLASTSLPQHMLYRFGPRLVALRPEAVDSFRDELVDKGYTPKVIRPNPAGA